MVIIISIIINIVIILPAPQHQYLFHQQVLLSTLFQAKKYAELRQTLDCTWSIIKKVSRS